VQYKPERLAPKPPGRGFGTGSHAIPSFSLKETKLGEFHLPATSANDSPSDNALIAQNIIFALDSICPTP
jgi:hypothetical protein